jgi:hypothetical protein
MYLENGYDIWEGEDTVFCESTQIKSIQTENNRFRQRCRQRLHKKSQENICNVPNV